MQFCTVTAAKPPMNASRKTLPTLRRIFWDVWGFCDLTGQGWSRNQCSQGSDLFTASSFLFQFDLFPFPSQNVVKLLLFARPGSFLILPDLSIPTGSHNQRTAVSIAQNIKRAPTWAHVNIMLPEHPFCYVKPPINTQIFRHTRLTLK